MSIQSQMYCRSQSGFTLIELMIALVLGLLITAAVLQVYLVSTKTSVIQKSGSTIVDAEIFGMQLVEEHIKLTGLGLSDKAEASAEDSGIILNQNNNLKEVKIASNDKKGLDVADALLTIDTLKQPGTNNQWTGMSNTNQSSDQLTIQYRAPQNTYDCEGKLALGPRKVDISGVPQLIDGQIIIERFFLRKHQGGIALACDAGRYINETIDDYSEQGKGYEDKEITQFTAANRIKGFDDNGEVLIANVDDFQVLLGVQTKSGIIYVNTQDYLDTSKKISTLPIVAIKLGVITRGDLALPSTESGASSFNLLGKTVTLKDDVKDNMIRNTYESNIMLRNSRAP